LISRCRARRILGQFRGQTEAELAAWLRQILAHNLTDLVRRFRKADARQVTRERSLDEMLAESSDALNQLLAGQGNSPSQSAERREMSVVLADALADLSADAVPPRHIFQDNPSAFTCASML
jgi:DNA-directed RNA polymerase specialized sigma24 family protein